MACTCKNVGISLTRYKLKEILSFVEKHSGACVGFQTQAHSTGVFRRYAGVTPRAYRLGNRASDPRADFFASAHPEPLAATI